MLKTAYAFGLRRNELLQLTVHDFGRNPKAAEFGEFGVCYVRFGKANAGSPPKRRSVLTVMPWSVDVIAEWVREVWPQVRHENASSLWPSEAAPRMSDARFNSAFVRLREAAGLPSELSMHCLRHSYVTHLIEDGFDALFVQQQVGHEHASTTSIYTSVSSDYKTRVLRAAFGIEHGRRAICCEYREQDANRRSRLCLWSRRRRANCGAPVAATISQSRPAESCAP
jgi:integrase/recombinase XerC